MIIYIFWTHTFKITAVQLLYVLGTYLICFGLFLITLIINTSIIINANTNSIIKIVLSFVRKKFFNETTKILRILFEIFK
jgi:hypothetical protein